MSKLNKAMVVGASVVTIGGAGLAAGTTASAHGGNGSWWNWGGYVSHSDDKFDAELSSELATKFSLDKAEVATAIEEVRDNQFNILDEERQEKLQEALSEGNLTQEQYDHVEAQLTEIDELYDQVDDANYSELRELKSQIRAKFKELKDWMMNEDLSWRILGFGDRWHHSHGWKDRQ